MPEEDWDPEKENKVEKLLEANQKMGQEFLDRLRAADEREKAANKAVEEAVKADLRDLQGKLEGVPPRVQRAYAFPVPTYEEIVKRLEACWADTKRIVGEAPPEVQTAVFHTLMQARGEAEMRAAVAEGPDQALAL